MGACNTVKMWLSVLAPKAGRFYWLNQGKDRSNTGIIVNHVHRFWTLPLNWDTVGVLRTKVQFNPKIRTNKYGGNTAKHN